MNASGFASFFAVFPAILGMGRPVSALVEYLIIGGAVVLVTGAVLVWVVGFRKSRRRKRGHRRVHPRPTESLRLGKQRESKTASASGGHRHREYPRHPTLAETGGLPPLRAPHPGSKDVLPH